jgi:arabinan endo-1,5-alpha-L-arabinosidase
VVPGDSPAPGAGATGSTAEAPGPGGAGGAANSDPDEGPAPGSSESEGGAAAAPAAGGSDGCDSGGYDGATPSALELSGNTFAHDPTMIEADGVFYRFWTGDDIPMATSTDLHSWASAPAVYRQGYSDWVRDWLNDNPGNTFNFPWAPDVSYFGGRHHIYSSFSAFFGQNKSCITHLSSADLASGEWTDHGPVICTDGSQNYNAIDADVSVDTDGTPWLAFGSFWDGIHAFELDQDGNRAGNDLTRLAWAREIEAPVLLHRCGYYYLFVTWGLCCPGEGRSVSDLTYRVAVGRSENIMGPYTDKAGVAMVDGGGTIVVQGDGVNFAAAGHSDVIATGNKFYHLYHAYRQSNGNAELRIVELPFDDDGWPVPGGL